MTAIHGQRLRVTPDRTVTGIDFATLQPRTRCQIEIGAAVATPARGVVRIKYPADRIYITQ
jgi:hypothetical protein